VLVERSGLLRDEQIALMHKIAATLADHGAMINERLRVAADGSMRFEASRNRAAKSDELRRGVNSDAPFRPCRPM
jgi:hypothetical protein